MKKYIFALSLLISSTSFAQTINLACQGEIVNNMTVKKYPDLNKKNQKDWLMFNVTIEPSTNSMIVGSSYYTNNLKYSTLSVSHSHYTMNHSWAKPNYLFDSIYISINRYTGVYKMSMSSLTSDTEVSQKLESQGTCQIGVHWSQKF